jgi:hypothetical protein
MKKQDTHSSKLLDVAGAIGGAKIGFAVEIVTAGPLRARARAERKSPRLPNGI